MFNLINRNNKTKTKAIKSVQGVCATYLIDSFLFLVLFFSSRLIKFTPSMRSYKIKSYKGWGKTRKGSYLVILTQLVKEYVASDLACNLKQTVNTACSPNHTCQIFSVSKD